MTRDSIVIRRGAAEDLAHIERIQAGSPEAAQWPTADYLSQTLFVAGQGGAVVGFLVARSLGEDEWELLNLAVDPGFRRQGIARMLLAVLPAGRTFLEVRAGNAAAVALYESAGFVRSGLRKEYYNNPVEDGIVMTLQK